MKTKNSILSKLFLLFIFFLFFNIKSYSQCQLTITVEVYDYTCTNLAENALVSICDSYGNFLCSFRFYSFLPPRSCTVTIPSGEPCCVTVCALDDINYLCGSTYQCLDGGGSMSVSVCCNQTCGPCCKVDFKDKINKNNESVIPDEYFLAQNYPNPFNPTTIIKYFIPKSGNVELKVYDILGKEVANLVDGFKNAGNYEVEFNGSNLSSGLYFYKLTASDFIDLKKMLIVK